MSYASSPCGNLLYVVSHRFRESALQNEFGYAEQQLRNLSLLSSHLPEDIQHMLNLPELESHLNRCRESYASLKRAQEEARRARKEAIKHSPKGPGRISKK